MADKKISVDSLDAEIQAILDNYSDSIKGVMQTASKNTANKAVKTLKQTSPQATGKYAKGWRAKPTSSKTSVGYTVHNAKKYQITHLLENGHIVKGAGGKIIGVAPAHSHIAAVADTAETDFINNVKKEVSKL